MLVFQKHLVNIPRMLLFEGRANKYIVFFVTHNIVIAQRAYSLPLLYSVVSTRYNWKAMVTASIPT